MDSDNFFSKYFFTDGSNLSVSERFKLTVILMMPFILFFLCFYFLTHYSLALEVLIAFLIFSLPLGYHFIYVDKFNSKYGRYSKLRFGYTYQHFCILFSLCIPGIIAIILILTNKVFTVLGILVTIAFVIPFVSAFFRTGVFNDSSCYIGDEVVFGYSPISIVISLFVGLFGFYNTYALLDVNSNNAILLFIITILFQIIFIIPDWANKIVPFEIRKKKGFLIYSALTGGAYLLISYCLIGKSMFPSTPIKFSPENIIIYGIGIILLILIIKQGRNMGKKEK